MASGFDFGTYTILHSRRDENGEIKIKEEINAFLEIELKDRFTFNMLKKSNVKLIERENVAYIIGKASVNLAYTLQLNLRRPMKDGILNSSESDSHRLLSIMAYSLIGEIPQDKEILYYSVPASSKDTNADYHQKALADILKKYKINNKTLLAFPINEALAIIFAELEHKNNTGIALSFGSGMVNCCYSKFSQIVFAFSSVNGGDWLDSTVAAATNQNVTVVNQEKTKISLLKPATNALERAVHIQYNLLIEKTVSAIKEALNNAGNKIRSNEPIDFVLAGGTSSPEGFADIFKDELTKARLNIEIGDVIKPKDPLYSVAKGCLIAAENA